MYITVGEGAGLPGEGSVGWETDSVCSFQEEEEEVVSEGEVAVFTRESITKEDPPHAHQAQPRPNQT